MQTAGLQSVDAATLCLACRGRAGVAAVPRPRAARGTPANAGCQSSGVSRRMSRGKSRFRAAAGRHRSLRQDGCGSRRRRPPGATPLFGCCRSSRDGPPGSGRRSLSAAGAPRCSTRRTATRRRRLWSKAIGSTFISAPKEQRRCPRAARSLWKMRQHTSRSTATVDRPCCRRPADRQLRRLRRSLRRRAGHPHRQDAMADVSATAVVAGVFDAARRYVSGMRDQIVSVGAFHAAAYDPLSGKEIWRVSYPRRVFECAAPGLRWWPGVHHHRLSAAGDPGGAARRQRRRHANACRLDTLARRTPDAVSVTRRRRAVCGDRRRDRIEH